MKKSLSAFLVFVMILSCIISLSSCSAQKEDKLLGTWQYSISSGNNLYATSTYTFTKSGDRYIATLKMGSASGKTSFTSTYSIEGNKIIFTLENGKTMTETFSLNGNILTIDGTTYIKK